MQLDNQIDRDGYSSSEYRQAAKWGLGRSNGYRWVNEVRDPTAETVKDIVKVLRQINPVAAEEFIYLYLGDDSAEDEDQSSG